MLADGTRIQLLWALIDRELSVNELAGEVAPEAARTEAYTWPLTALVGGIALGAAASGAIADSAGWQTAVLVAAVAAACGTVVSAGRRATLMPASS